MMRLADMMREIRALTIEERIELAEAIWDSVEEDCEVDDGLTDAQKRELEKRLAAYEASGYKGDSWENVRKRIRARAKAEG